MNLKRGKYLIEILKHCGDSFLNQFIKISILKVIVSFTELLGLALLFSSITILLNQNSLNQYLELAGRYIDLDLNSTLIVIAFLGLVFLFFALKNLFGYWVENQSIFYTRKLIYELNKRVISSFYQRGYWFLKGEKTFGFAHKTGGMSLEFGMVVLKTVWQIISDLSLLVFFVFLSAYSSFTFSLVLLSLSIPITLLIYIRLKPKAVATGRARHKQIPENNKILFDLFAGYVETRIYGTTDQFISKYLESLKKLVALRTIQGKLNLAPKRLLEMLAVAIIISIYFLHQWRASHGFESSFLVDFGLLGLFGYKILPGLARIIESAITLSNTAQSRINLLENLKPVKSILKPIISQVIENIRLSKVSLDFNEKKVLNQLDFTINKGEIIGIMGPSGTGKSTLTKILIGLLKPTNGKVLINEQEQDIYLNESWHRKFGFVGESLLLFEGGVYENIAFNTEKQIDTAKIEALLKICQLEDYIGKNPNVGDMGDNLSSGIKQRIAFARALYHEPEFLILDEFSANLDYKNEDNLLNLVKEMTAKNKMTVLIISHRSRTMKIANKIFELKNGKLEMLESVE